ncbi:gluconolactonase [Hyaloraphidium curvatum]|nr:gluconolactonase [Hyaloraphidium curvatum]
MAKTYKSEVVVEGLSFGEGPRWHDGKLYYSDFYVHQVKVLDPETNKAEVYVELPDKEQPSGLGWLPDGRMLIVAMTARKLLVREHDGKLKEYADLKDLAGFYCNDMVVSSSGVAYVGNFGFDLHHEMREKGVEAVLSNPTPANLIKVSPAGKVSVASPDMLFPNGSQITPDGKTLIVGETLGMRLTAFDIGPDGDLSNRRIWAPTPGVPCDGSCLDAEGAVWVANPFEPSVVRFKEGGEILAKVQTSQNAFACMLGGEDRKTLYCVTAPDSDSDNRKAAREGRIEIARVDVPGAGLP